MYGKSFFLKLHLHNPYIAMKNWSICLLFLCRHGGRGHGYHDICVVLHFCKGLECINKWDYIADRPKIPPENLVASRKKSKAS